MQTTLQNTIEIKCSPKALYAYVTQPWLWHEWHPNSKSATASVDRLKAGDEFDEVVELQPFSPLPIKLRRQTRYRVLAANPHSLWETKGLMKDGWLQIRYEFSPTAAGTLFTRSLSYSASGASRLLMPLLRKRMETMSRIALGNLKRRLESA